MHSIGDTPYSYPITSILIVYWGWNCVHIVSAVEKCLATKSSCKVERRVEISFWGSAFAKVSHSNSVVTIYSILVSGTGSLRNLCAKRRRDSNYVKILGTVMNRHLFALANVKLITCQLVSHLLNAKASPEERARFSVLRENQVVAVESSCSAYTWSFLS